MIRLIERCLSSLDAELVMLAPANVDIPDFFGNVTDHGGQRRTLVEAMQRLRGSIYVQEGNIRADQLTDDDRHVMAEDDRCWHLLMTDPDGRVRSCAMYIDHGMNARFEDLRAARCPLAESAQWGSMLKAAVETELASARRANLRFAELGGWAIERQRRGTPEGLMMALATYGLSRIVGGSLGMTTANVAHSCSAILRRLGGAFFEVDGTPIPTYFDPRYNTEIDLLRFDSRRPSSKYEALIETARQKLRCVTIIGESVQRPMAYEPTRLAVRAGAFAAA